jgi:hypothetical protein
MDFVSTRVVRASGSAFHQGVEEFVIDLVDVAVTNPSKTVADFFRYRSHVGFDAALAALESYMERVHDRKDGRCSLTKLNQAMHFTRMTEVMRPYVEALA